MERSEVVEYLKSIPMGELEAIYLEVVEARQRADPLEVGAFVELDAYALDAYYKLALGIDSNYRSDFHRKTFEVKEVRTDGKYGIKGRGGFMSPGDGLMSGFSFIVPRHVLLKQSLFR